MVLSWYGGQCVLVESRTRGEAPRSILFFPDTKTSRARTLEEKAQVVVFGEDDGKIGGDAYRISTPGEYDVAGFMIRGVSVDHGTAFVVESEELSACIFPERIPGELKDRDIEALGEVEILIVPVTQVQSVGKVNMLVRELEPRIVIPLLSDSKIRSALSQEVGADAENMEKFSIARKDIAEEGIRLIFLQA